MNINLENAARSLDKYRAMMSPNHVHLITQENSDYFAFGAGTNAYASLHPRWTIERTLMEPMLVYGMGSRGEQRDRVLELLGNVGLNPSYAKRYPHEFSGGQRQRIGIARALVLQPQLIIADEPVSALDISIQAQVINLLQDLQEQYKLTYMFISHDLSVVRHISDRVAVMYLGRIVELAEKEKLFETPMHPYTHSCLRSPI